MLRASIRWRLFVVLLVPAFYIAFGVYAFVISPARPTHPPGSMAFVPLAVFWWMMGIIVLVAVATAVISQRFEKPIIDADTSERGVATLGTRQVVVPTTAILAFEILRPERGRGGRAHGGISAIVATRESSVERVLLLGVKPSAAKQRRLARQLADILEVPLRDGHAGEVDANGRFIETPRELAEPAA
jgi:hypothetical protein